MRLGSYCLCVVAASAILKSSVVEADPQGDNADALVDTAIQDALLQGNTSTGLKLLDELVANREQKDGTDSPSLLSPLRWRGYLRAMSNDVPGALEDFRRSYDTGQHYVSVNAQRISNSELARFVRYLDSDRDLVCSLLADHPEDQSVAAVALRITRAQKGRLMELAAEKQSQARLLLQSSPKESEMSTEISRVLRDNEEIRSQYRAIALTASLPFDQKTVQQLRALESRITHNEELIVQRSGLASFAQRALEIRYTPQLMAFAVPQMGNWYVDYAEFRRYSFEKGQAASAPKPEYIGFLTRFDGTVFVAPLGPATEIDALAQNLQGVMSNPQANYEPVVTEGYRRLLAPLFEQVVPKVPRSANDTFEASILNRFISIFPDGNLNLVSFQALRDNNGFLGDKYRIGYAGSALDLGFLPRQSLKPASSVVVFANPDFSNSLPKLGAQHSVAEVLRQKGIKALPGTQAEAVAIHRLLPRAQIFENKEATRRRLVSSTSTSPGVLHLATHGLFVSRTEDQSENLLDRPPDSLSNDAYQGLLLAPLIDTGLVLAGAEGDATGGIVSAIEILNLDLSGTQLVVLSACDTGRGYIKPGDSVYGLRHAFLLAGAETVVASLWEIDDTATKTVVARYYGNLMRGMGRLDAMVEAAREQRKQTDHPAYWAAFTVTGNFNPVETPLRGASPSTTRH